MNENRFLGFDPQEDPELAERTGHLIDAGEGRDDLFRTRIYSINSEGSSDAQNVLVVARDPGAAKSLTPVIKELERIGTTNITIIADGRAQEQFQDEFDLSEEEAENPLGADKLIPTPELILTEASAEQGLESYANATFPETPMVAVDSYYDYKSVFLQAAAKRPGMHLPERICVIDEVAKDLIVQNIPELEPRIVVTGSPTADKIAGEDVPTISKEAREKMQIDPQEKVIAFMSINTVSIDQFRRVCEQMKQAQSDFILVFRKHPRDNSNYEDYFEMFDQMGIRWVDSRMLTTDQVSACADLVCTFWSTAGLEAIYRGKPTIHVTDTDLTPDAQSLHLPLPLVKLGASVGVSDLGEIPNDIDQLLDLESILSVDIKQKMERYYPNDGKNSKRIVDVVTEVLEAHKKGGE